MKSLLISTLLFAVFSIGVHGWYESCGDDATINAVAAGNCHVVEPLGPCVPTSGTCGWGTRVIKYYCGYGQYRQEYNCDAKCCLPCDPPLTTCPHHFYSTCSVVKHSLCSKTCGVGEKQVEYRCHKNGKDYYYKCVQECCCKPCGGGGIIQPTKPCQGYLVVDEEDRRKCCPLTFFPSNL